MALATKRLQWLKWLYPGEAGLQSDQQWHIDKRRQHMSQDHLPGVQEWLELEVVPTSPTPDLFVHVEPGRAVDANGAEVRVESTVDLDLSAYAAGGALVYIVAEFGEQGTDPYIVPETSASQNKFLQDDPQITHQTGAPTGGQIELARVTVGNGVTQIFSTDIDDDNTPLLTARLAGRPFENTKDVVKNASGAQLYYQVPTLGSDGSLSVVRWRRPQGWIYLDPNINPFSRLSAAQPGDKFWLMPGTYNVTAEWSVGSVVGGADDVEIAGSRDAVLRMNASGAALSFRGARNKLSGVTVEVVNGGSGRPASINFIEADDGEIKDVNVICDAASDLAFYAIGVDTSPRMKVRDVTIMDSGTYALNGIYVDDSPHCSISDCHLRVGAKGLDLNDCSGIMASSVHVYIADDTPSGLNPVYMENCDHASVVDVYVDMIDVTTLPSAAGLNIVNCDYSKFASVTLYTGEGTAGDTTVLRISYSKDCVFTNIRVDGGLTHITDSARNTYSNFEQRGDYEAGGVPGAIIFFGNCSSSNWSNITVELPASASPIVFKADSSTSGNFGFSTFTGIVVSGGTNTKVFQGFPGVDYVNISCVMCIAAGGGDWFIDPAGGIMWQVNRFGAYEGDCSSGSPGAGPYAGRTVYQADCDMIVVLHTFYGSTQSYVVYAAETAITYPAGAVTANLRGQRSSAGGSGVGYPYDTLVAFVRKGEYWFWTWQMGSAGSNGMWCDVMRLGGGTNTPPSGSSSMKFLKY